MFGGNNIEKIKELGNKGKTKKILPYTSSKNPEERAAAAEALGNTSTDETLHTLINMLHDSDVSVGINAATALGKVGFPAAIEHLRHAANNSADDKFKSACTASAASLSKNSKQ